ncbi:hypothetical protein QE152_g31190 [Popillia japonica]|uniref:Peptidase A2 domain-containing protein n=1 Tax=Popillia japonica TaxID=7064 RepID=A0AAW1JBL0_POPJA
MYNLCLPKLPEDKSYKELADLFNKYFKVAESIFVARSKFFAAFKNSSETANELAARVRSLASNCSFEEAVIDMMLRDRFIIGFNKGAVQSKLFKEAITRTFAEVIEVAVAEMAAEVPSGTASNFACVKMEPGIHHVTSRNMTGQMTSTSSTKDQSIQRSPGKCSCCGRSNHDTAKCRFRSYACHICKAKGHLAPVCPNRQNKSKMLGNKDTGASISAMSDNISHQFHLDTGASISAMSDNFWKDNFANNYKLLPANKSLNVYTGEKMPVLGMCEFMIIYNNKKKCLCIFVIKNGGPPILGRDFMNLFGFAITQVNFANSCDSIESLIKKFDKVFSPGLGTFNRGTVTLKLKDESVTPKFIKARPLPYGMREKVEIELDNLVKLGVIKPVDYSTVTLWNAEHITTGVSPAFLMFGRHLTTRFSNLKPEVKQEIKNRVLMFGRHLTTRFSNLKPEVKQEIKNRVLHKQMIQSAYYGGKDTRKFRIGEKVIVKDYRQNNKSTWILGILKKIIGKCTYIVNIPELNREWKRHTNQIRKTKVQSGVIDHEISTEFGGTTNSDNPNEVVSKEIEIARPSRPKRNIKPPDRLIYER